MKTLFYDISKESRLVIWGSSFEELKDKLQNRINFGMGFEPIEINLDDFQVTRDFIGYSLIQF